MIMDIQNLFNQFLGSGNDQAASNNPAQGAGSALGKMASNIPGGLVGGAAAGGIMALLVGNKKARKFAGKAATYGGAAVVGGLAYRALQNYQQNKSQNAAAGQVAANIPEPQALPEHSANFDLALIKAMIAAAKADGHINDIEQQRIFNAIEQMDLSTEMKALVFDLLRQPISVAEIAQGIESLEEKSEIYLASCLAIDPDHPSELAHLEQLAQAFNLPGELAQQLQLQAREAVQQAA
jgi:uncharacterized membrane protein YebE (DUF533 family)